MNKEVICINDKFAPEWQVYFEKHNIITPREGVIYTIREIVHFLKGEKGVLLNEIVNPKTPMTSPTTGMKGTGEQSWAISRFTYLNNEPLKQTNHEKKTNIQVV